MGIIAVIRPGMFTTVQDLGRPGWSAMGVPAGGAADTLSLRIGNRLVGNPDCAAALEMTMLGGEFTFDDGAIVAIVGGACECSRSEPGSSSAARVPMNQPLKVEPGSTLTIGPIVRGVRAYLCIGGGIVVPAMLGSASTNPAAAFGGVDGRAIRAGDRIEFGHPLRQPATHPRSSLAELHLFGSENRATLRAVPAAHDSALPASLANAFWSANHTISQRSDRTGVRLLALPGAMHTTGEMTSEGMPAGAIQIPPGGEPIILGPDHPTTGGYPIIGCVAAVDLPRIGQLRPGDTLRFDRISQTTALDLFRERERTLDTVLPPA